LSPSPADGAARLVRVGVADSGINPRDPQVGGVAGGIGLRFRDGRVERDDDWEDLLGHGTAVAATIRGRAPQASLVSIRIFRRRLEAPLGALLHAVDWASAEKLDLLNLSLGCEPAEANQRAAFADVCSRAMESGLTIVAAAGRFAIPGVIPVAPDPDLADGSIRAEAGCFFAPPWARARGPLPRERNFRGASFAVATVTGIAARLMAEYEGLGADGVAGALERFAGAGGAA